MALNTPQLKQQIKAAFNDQTVKDDDPDAAIDDLAQKIADAVHAYVTGATVTVAPGIVTTTPAGPGSTTSTGTGTIS